MVETIKEIALLLNPWWNEGRISKELAKDYKRQVFNDIAKLIDKKLIVILSGLRRVGKTTLLYQIIELLLKKTAPKNIFYFNMDKKVEELTEMLNAYGDLTSIDWKKEKIFVFIDEISKLKDWGRKIKLIYDAFPNIKFLISSSGSVGLEEEAIANLAGRYFLISITPLNFREFLELRGNAKYLDNINLWEKEIIKEAKDYILRSFPEIVLWKDELLIKDYLRTTLIDKIIRQDLPEKFSNIDKDLLFTLLQIFYSEPGMIIDYDGMSKKLRISKKTLVSHIYYLEFSYLIRRIRNFRPSTLTSSKKLQKIYAYWWTLACCYTDNEDKIIENLAASYLNAKYYWRKNGKEIDFLSIKGKKVVPIEIKNKKDILATELKSMQYFIKKFKVKESIAVYNGIESELNNVKLLPLWKFLINF